MDRNYYTDKDADWVRVALRKESVDRNRTTRGGSVVGSVALRKESVDRNCPTCQWRRSVKLSLSARRAWIEIKCYFVILLAVLSLSARRAWIEIT